MFNTLALLLTSCALSSSLDDKEKVEDLLRKATAELEQAHHDLRLAEAKVERLKATLRDVRRELDEKRRKERAECETRTAKNAKESKSPLPSRKTARRRVDPE